MLLFKQCKAVKSINSANSVNSVQAVHGAELYFISIVATAIAFLAYLPFLMIGNLQFEIYSNLFSAIPANVKHCQPPTKPAARRPPPAHGAF